MSKPWRIVVVASVLGLATGGLWLAVASAGPSAEPRVVTIDLDDLDPTTTGRGATTATPIRTSSTTTPDDRPPVTAATVPPPTVIERPFHGDEHDDLDDPDDADDPDDRGDVDDVDDPDEVDPPEVPEPPDDPDD